MTEARIAFGFARTECACEECVTNCHYIPGYLIPEDIARIAARLNETDLLKFALGNLQASPGATVMANGKLYQIPTLVPSREPGGTCKFLRDDRCVIHEVSPFGCAFFDHRLSREEADAISSRGLAEIAQAWRRGDLYARLWMALDMIGRNAPSPNEARSLLRAALALADRRGGRP